MRSAGVPLAFAIATCLIATFGLWELAAGHDDKGRKDLEQEFLLLQALDTGYEYQERYVAEDMPKFSQADIRYKIKELCGIIVCYYVYLTTYHKRLVRHLMQRPTYMKYLKKYSFFREARMLLIVAYAFTGGPEQSMRPLWLSFMYELYLLLLANDKLMAGPDVLQAAHDTVIAELTVYTMGKCHQKNKYNSAYRHSEYDGNLERLDKHPDASQVRWLLATMNKYRIIYQLGGNELTLRTIADNESWFSIDALYMNRVVQNDTFMVHLLRDFAEQREWKTVLALVKEDYEMIAQQDRPDRWIKQLGYFLGTFIDLLKVVMLRIVCRYVDYLDHVVPTLATIWAFRLRWISMPCMLHRNGKLILDSLNEFVKHFDLESDFKFRTVINMFGGPICNFVTKERRNEIVGTINAMMTDILTPSKFKLSYSNKLHTNNECFKQILHLTSQHDIFKEEENVTPNPLVNQSITIAAIFVEYLKKALNGISIKVIRSYIEFAQDLEDFHY